MTLPSPQAQPVVPSKEHALRSIAQSIVQYSQVTQVLRPLMSLYGVDMDVEYAVDPEKRILEVKVKFIFNSYEDLDTVVRLAWGRPLDELIRKEKA